MSKREIVSKREIDQACDLVEAYNRYQAGLSSQNQEVRLIADNLSDIAVTVMWQLTQER